MKNLKKVFNLKNNKIFRNILAIPYKIVFCNYPISATIPTSFSISPNCLGVALNESESKSMTRILTF